MGVKASTNRQIVFVRVEEVVEVVDGHRQVGLMDQAGRSHAVVSSCSLSIWTHTDTHTHKPNVNIKISGFQLVMTTSRFGAFESMKGKNFALSYVYANDDTDWPQFTPYLIKTANDFLPNSIIKMLMA